MSSQSEILDFIDEFKKIHPEEIIDLFSNGYCYYFTIILAERFHKAGIVMYIPIYNHFCYKLWGKVYDIKGEITNPEFLELMESWDSYMKNDELEAGRIIRDCILKVPDKDK